ncbi:MAG: class I SAM-dependent methyltransferase [Chthoniobacterales bacterium]
MTTQNSGYTGVEILEALRNATNYNALLVSLIAQGANGRRAMVDFGAGIGTFAKLLRERGVSITCIEPDPVLATNLIREGFTTFPDVEALKDDSVDFLFSLNVVEHIEDDEAAVGAIVRKLKRDGRLLIYVPAFQCLWTSLDTKVKHFRRYRRRELEKLVRSPGLKVCQSRYVDTLGFAAALLFKLGGNGEGELKPSLIKLYDRYVIPISKVLDHIFGRLFGKNVYVICEKDS